MVEQHDTPAAPNWSAPRLVALGTAQGSQAGGTPRTTEVSGIYNLVSP